jgi:competence protein ComEC
LVCLPNIWLGKLLTWGIMGMNTWIQWLDKIPGAVTHNIQISLQQTICLYGITMALLLKRGMVALAIGVLFAGLHAYDSMQKKIIIYNGNITCLYGKKSKQYKTETLIQFEGKRILRLTGRLPNKPPAKRIKIDYILLSHNPHVDISRLHDYFIYELIIFDSSNTPFLIRKWKSACKKLPLRFFSVPDEGAFVVNL